MKGLILFIISLVLCSIVYPIGFMYSVILTLLKNGYTELDKYLFQCAISQDQHANTWLAKLFNDVLIKQGGAKFGDTDETISSVLGKNQLANKLTKLGKYINSILHKIEKDHSIKSIGK
jgi:8-oxo-dGTP diphosphatase